MQKKVLYSLVFLLFFWLEAKTQVTPPCSNPPPQGGTSCGSTCVYCDFDGYSGNTSNGTGASISATVCGNIVVHNDQWLGFVATEPSMEIVVTSSNCTLGDGVQLAFFAACGTSNALICNPGGNNLEGIPLTLSYNSFTPGQTYYLMIDGSNGDVCDFDVDITQGSVVPPPAGFPEVPDGPTDLCPGAVAVYTIPPVDGASFYQWSAPAGARINGSLTNPLSVPAPQGTTVTITFGNAAIANANVCVAAGNACSPSNQECLQVHLVNIPVTLKPHLTLCYEDRVFHNPESPYTTTTLPVGNTTLNATYDSYLSCDSIVRQTITVLPPITKALGTKYICQGSCFVLNNQSYCSPGPQQQLIVSDVACDTALTFNIVIIPATANIQAVPQINCAMPNLTLNSAGSSGGSTTTYRWTNSTWSTLGSATTQNVSGPGTYNLVVTNNVNGNICRDTATVTVTSTAAFPGANATGGTITCISPNVGLQSSSPTSGINYSWAGPGITPANQFLQNPTVSAAGTYTVSITNPANQCTSTATAEVVPDNALPTATAVGGTVSCLQASIMLDGGSNIPNATYTWVGPGINAGNQNQENPTVSVAGSYTVTVRNPANGCTQTASATVNSNSSPPVASAGTDQSINCQQASVVLNGSATGGGTLQYSWTGPGITPANQTQQTPSVTTGGTYILSVLNTTNGCSDADTVQVSQLTTPPVASAGADRILNCGVTSAVLDGSGTSQGANLSVVWSGPGINAGNQNVYSPTVTAQGTYTVTVTNSVSLCSATDNVVVTLNNAAPSVNAGTDQILTCTSTNGVTLNGTGGPAGVTYLWTGPDINAGNQASPNPTVDLPGTYSLQITNPANQCSATDQVVVSQDANAPVAMAGTDQVLNCTVTSVTIGASGSSSGAGISYLWTGPGITGANQNQLMPTVSDDGTYVLQVNNSNNGCSATDTIVIAEQVAFPTAAAGNDSTLNCMVQSIVLNGAGSSQGAGFTVVWSGPDINAGNQNSYTPMIDLPGSYSVTITNTANNCTATDNVTISLDNAVPTVSAGTDEVLTCTTQTGIALNGSGTPASITYVWTGPSINASNATMPNPTIMEPGTYNLTVTNPVNHCTATDLVVITEDANVPMASAGANLTITCSVSSVNIDASTSSSGAGIGYTWTGPGISGANATAQNPQNITVPGTYFLTVTNSNNNCTNTASVSISIDTITPLSSAGNDLVLNCFNNSADTLDASASSQGAGFTLLWTGPGINATNQNLPRPVVDQAGQYTVLITNTTNNCTASADAMVVADTISPIADAGLAGTIDCANSSVQIGGNSSSGSNFEYLWTGPDIDQSNQDLASLDVEEPGTYSLSVVNTVNGCSASASVLVDEDLAYPLALAGADTVITCENATITLNAAASSSGAGIQISWSGQSITPANESSVNPDVTEPDLYILTVTNTVNSCVSKDSVLVDEDTVLPDAIAGPDALLDCQTTNTTLNASGSSVGSNITYLWTGPGITPANEAQQNPLVDEPGIYNLVVTNTENGCVAQDELEVAEDVQLPIADAGQDLLLDCQNPSQSINGSGSSTGAGVEYLWVGPGINSSNFNVLNPMVGDSGTYIVTVTFTTNHCTATDFVFVGESADLPVISAGADQTLTCAIDTLQLDGALSQSGPNITYSWSGPGIVAGETALVSPNVYLAGNYTLTITNTDNGCSNTDIVTVLQDTIAPLVLAGDDQILTCANSTTGVTLSSAGSSSGTEFTIQWSGSGITPANDTLPNPQVTGVGPYILTITNTLTGCTRTDEVVVEQDQDAPTSIAGEDQTISCIITQVSLDGSASSSPSGLLEYTWSGPGITPANANDPVITVQESGNFTLTIVNPQSGCQATDNVEVFLDTEPPVASATADTITCQDPLGALSVTSSDPGSVYEWAGLGITPANINLASLQVNQPGNYSVTVTAANGCTTVVSTTMGVDANFPIGAAEGDQLNCLNEGVGTISGTVTTPGASFFWSGPNGFNATTETTTVTVAGAYTFNVVAANGCINPIAVTVSSDFIEPTVVASVPGNLNCTTTSLSINGTGTSTGGNYSYEWTTADGNILSGDNTLAPVVDAPGNYVLVVTNLLNGCSNTESIVVANDPNVPTALDLTVRDIKCFGEKNGVIAVTGINGGLEPFVFSLNGATGSTVDQFSNLAAGEYLISMEDANGCQLDTLISISEPGLLSVELGPDITVHLGDSVSVNAQITNETPIRDVKWNFSPNLDSLECCSFSYLPLQTYRHEITVQDSNSCVARDVVTINVRRDRQVFIPNILDFNSDNPLNNVLMIQGGNDVVKIHSWLIFDRWGNSVFEVQNFLPNDPEYAWNGNVRGSKGQPAVFVWVAEIEFLDGQVEIFEGDVTIVR